MLTPPEFEHYLRTEVGLNDAQLQDFERQTMKSVAYAMAASRDKFIKKKGMFQLLGVDLIWDDKLRPYLIEFNTSAGLYNLLRGHLFVVP
jgi:D-alanine-D-alanine ligase-like ATP-grasp enzyme